MRAFNLRCGIGPESEMPSKRYGSVPLDGPAKGQDISQHWDQMVQQWYDLTGYDRASGKPKAETLLMLGLDDVAQELWG